MLQVLEFKGFITTSESGARLRAHQQVVRARHGPGAGALAGRDGAARHAQARPGNRQSCHIAVASKDQIVVITRIERPGDLGFSVRIGYRREIARATSGLVLFAYQNEEVRRTWLKRCRLKGEAADSFVERANTVRARGDHEAASDFVRGWR